ncbi:MAG: hypothetical protein AAF570_26845, partial [Bacteroidota bacterium]
MLSFWMLSHPLWAQGPGLPALTFRHTMGQQPDVGGELLRQGSNTWLLNGDHVTALDQMGNPVFHRTYTLDLLDFTPREAAHANGITVVAGDIANGRDGLIALDAAGTAIWGKALLRPTEELCNLSNGNVLLARTYVLPYIDRYLYELVEIDRSSGAIVRSRRTVLVNFLPQNE